MADLFAGRDGDFRGLMINLYAGDTLVGGHFGVRQGDVYHPWIASTNPELPPGRRGRSSSCAAIAAMPELGLSRYDLGPGHDHYKRSYGRNTMTIGEGAATGGYDRRAHGAVDRKRLDDGRAAMARVRWGACVAGWTPSPALN
jgi:CelD/BcsL family acetyltransferase involved in cellulose biosynthesis